MMWSRKGQDRVVVRRALSSFGEDFPRHSLGGKVGRDLHVHVCERGTGSEVGDELARIVPDVLDDEIKNISCDPWEV